MSVPQRQQQQQQQQQQPDCPSLPWRIASSSVMGITGLISKGVMNGINTTETFGLEAFLDLLEKRRDPARRERGLITISNHVSVLDDPLVWGLLPLRFSFSPDALRWSMGSHDLCFTNKALSTFFTLGQVLPTHRKKHSIYGGLFQPTITEAIKLLSAAPFTTTPTNPTKTPTSISMSPTSPDIIDPFTSGILTYTTNGTDTFVSPSSYASRRHSWIHIFPEGFVHQHPKKTMRYFKWGVSRLILESEPIPDIVPMFIDGNQQIMHESRTFPRFLPRAGRNIRVAFGEALDGEEVFGDLRRKWKKLVGLQKEALRKKGLSEEMVMGELTEGLKYGDEATAIRIEVTRRVREEVLRVRRSLGLPDEDPKVGLVETWLEEGGKGEGRRDDGSWVGDT